MKTRKQYLIDLQFTSSENPSDQEIKHRFRQLSFKEHPDRGGDDEKFRCFSIAYEALTEKKYLEFDEEEPNKIDIENLGNKVSDYLINTLNNCATKVEAKGKRQIIKLIGNKIVVINNEATEDKIIKVGNNIIKVQNK